MAAIDNSRNDAGFEVHYLGNEIRRSSCNRAAEINNQLIDSTRKEDITTAIEFSQYLDRFEVDLSSPLFW